MLRVDKIKIENSKIVNLFLDRKSSSISTKKTYKSALKKYFKILKIRNIDKYFESNRDYKEDVWEFAKKIIKSPPKSQSTFLAVVKGFLERNNVEIKKSEWQDIIIRNKIRNPRPIIQKRTPSNADMKTILSYGDIKSRSLFMFACCTGMRIDEILSLEMDDIDFDNRHVRIRREIAKGGIPRDTFFTEEVKDVLEKWLVERERHLLRRYHKSVFVRNKLEREGYKLRKVDDEWFVFKDSNPVDKKEIVEMESRVFPYGYVNALKMWHGLLEKAGTPYNKKDGNYFLYNIHSLRRFWFTQMESSGANISHINYIGGHESELNATYTHFEFRDLKETYDQHMNYLSIFSEMDKVDKILKPKIEAQDAAITSVMRENKKLSDEIDEMLKLMYYSTGQPPITKEQKRNRELFREKLEKRLGKDFLKE